MYDENNFKKFEIIIAIYVVVDGFHSYIKEQMSREPGASCACCIYSNGEGIFPSTDKTLDYHISKISNSSIETPV